MSEISEIFEALRRTEASVNGAVLELNRAVGRIEGTVGGIDTRLEKAESEIQSFSKVLAEKMHDHGPASDHVDATTPAPPKPTITERIVEQISMKVILTLLTGLGIGTGTGVLVIPGCASSGKVVHVHDVAEMTKTAAAIDTPVLYGPVRSHAVKPNGESK